MPGYFVLADSISSPFLLPFAGCGLSAKRLEAGNELGIPGVMAEAGGPPGGGIAADISDDDGLAHGGMPGGMAGGMPGGMPGGMATGGMPGGMAGGIAAGTSDTPGIAGGMPGGGIIAAVQGAKHC